jgi:hypothetical protein
LRGLEPQIGELARGAEAQLDAAADLADTISGDDWWIWRLPLYAQFFLLLLTLEAIEKASAFIDNVTGEGVSPTFRSGIEALFALGFALQAVMEMRARAESSDEAD